MALFIAGKGKGKGAFGRGTAACRKAFLYGIFKGTDCVSYNQRVLVE